MKEQARPIKVICDERGIRQSWLARQLGISRPYLSQIVGGTRPAPQFFYERVSGILNVPLDSIRPKEPVAA